MGNRLIHFEFNSSDPAALIAFFEDVFDWSFTRWGGHDYWLATTGEGEPGINGAVGLVPEGVQPHTLNTIEVKNLDDAISACEKAGGSRLGEIREIPGVGRWCRVAAPGGNEFGMMEPVDA